MQFNLGECPNSRLAISAFGRFPGTASFGKPRVPVAVLEVMWMHAAVLYTRNTRDRRTGQEFGILGILWA